MADAEEFETDLEYDNEALMLMREDASKSLEYLLRKHDAHQKKSAQIIQINGVVISLLLAAGTQVGLNIFLLIGGFLFVTSAIVSGFALRGTLISVGLSTDQISSNIDEEINKNQYLRWYLEGYYHEAFTDLSDKTSKRAWCVRYSLYAFLAGLVLTATGIVIQLSVQLPYNG